MIRSTIKMLSVRLEGSGIISPSQAPRCVGGCDAVRSQHPMQPARPRQRHSENDIAEKARYNYKPLLVLYVGDHDTFGLKMSQIDLPWFPASEQSGDPRHKCFTQNHGSKCWELDAMNPNNLRERVENAILDHIVQEIWDHAVEVEKAEIESLRGFATSWKSILTQAPK